MRSTTVTSTSSAPRSSRAAVSPPKPPPPTITTRRRPARCALPFTRAALGSATLASLGGDGGALSLSLAIGSQPLEQVLADAHGVGHRRQRGVDGGDGGE